MEQLESRCREFEEYLYLQEKAELTIRKYLQDVGQFLEFADGEDLSKEVVLDYKRALQERYQISSANSKLAALNLFFDFIGRGDCRVKQFRVQKTFFGNARQYLSQEEYARLVRTAEAEGDVQLSLIMQTLCSTGIRISELPCITVQNIKAGTATITNKGKTRLLIISKKLKGLLLAYCKREGIREGAVFCGKNGRPVDRSVVWRRMKRLCASARVAADKVFPHNLRHLFALTFYRRRKDLLSLAEILGHTSMETTRIYARTPGMEYERMVSGLGLICGASTKKSHNRNYVIVKS